MKGIGGLVVVFCLCASAAFSQSQNLTANQIHVTSLQFFDAGYNPPEYGRRFFQTGFSNLRAKYIYWELNLEFPAGNYGTLSVDSYWYRTGEQNSLFHYRNDLTLQPDWSTAYFFHSWGWQQPGNWATGTYQVDFYVQNQKISSGTFEIYDERGMKQKWQVTFGQAEKVEELESNAAYYLANGDNANYQQTLTKLADAYVDRGGSRYLSGDSQGGLQDLNSGINLNSKLPYAFSNRGNIRLQLGDKKGAMADYNMAISLKPDDAGFYDKRGSLLFDEGDQKGGMQDLNQAVLLVPNNPEYYDHRAYMKAFMGDRKGAIEDSQKAAEFYKKNNQEEDYKRVLENLRKLQAQISSGPGVNPRPQ